MIVLFFFFQAEDGIRDLIVTGVQTCALPISIILVSCARRRSFIKGHPSCFCGRVAHSRPISQPAKTYVEFLSPKAAWTNLGKVLQFKKDFAISAFPKTVDHRFALFVIFGQGPGTNRLDMPSAEAWPTVSIENVSTSRLIKNGPDL